MITKDPIKIRAAPRKKKMLSWARKRRKPNSTTKTGYVISMTVAVGAPRDLMAEKIKKLANAPRAAVSTINVRFSLPELKRSLMPYASK